MGSGAFSTVWLARDEDLDAWVAIKLLAENWALSEDARSRFTLEARALRRLDNDRIVRVYEAGLLADGRPYMVMEFADRGTLEDRMRLRAGLGQPFSVHEALGLGIEMAECLIAVHDLAIVNRDVKPSNVLFRSVSLERKRAMRRDGKPVERERTMLGDFGIALRLEGPRGHTVVGSPSYMAPEQADPERAHLVDERSDLYSAAVILFEILAVRLPSQRVRLDGVRPDMPHQLAASVHRGLARDPALRFASAGEWRDALRQAREDLSSERRSRAGPALSSGGSGRPTVRVDSGGVRRAPASAASATLPVPRVAETVTLPTGPAPARVRAVGGIAGASIRIPGATAALAGGLALAGALLPWVAIRGGPRGLSEGRLGIAVPGGGLAVLGAFALLMAGVRLWTTTRRWVALLASIAAAAAGVELASVGLYELAVIRGRVRLTPAGAAGGSNVAYGIGLAVTLGASLLGFVAGSVALRRLRRLRRLERHPLLRLP